MHALLSEARRRYQASEDGFTLIELLVVVVIIGILIAIAIPLYLNYQKGANDKAAQSDVRGGISTLEQCAGDNNDFPKTTDVAAQGSPVTSYSACSGQTIRVSSGTTLTYTYVAADASTNKPASFVLVGTNAKGSGKSYCYNSIAGGSVKAGSSC